MKTQSLAHDPCSHHSVHDQGRLAQEKDTNARVGRPFPRVADPADRPAVRRRMRL